jgi:hypothetical protein
MLRTMTWHQQPLSIIYGILSLTNSTLLTSNMILLCTKKPSTQLMIHIPLSVEECVFSCSFHATALPSDLLH